MLLMSIWWAGTAATVHFPAYLCTKVWGKEESREKGQKIKRWRKDNLFLRQLLLFQDMFFALLKWFSLIICHTCNLLWASYLTGKLHVNEVAEYMDNSLNEWETLHCLPLRCQGWDGHYLVTTVYTWLYSAKGQDCPVKLYKFLFEAVS